MAAAEAAGLKAMPTGLAHGTVTVVAGEHPYEITTLRRDVETHGRHATVAFTDDWAEDARRRDFTLNALYCDADGTLFDPLGGYPDLAARRVRFIGDATAAHPRGLPAHPALLPPHRRVRRRAGGCREPRRLRARARRPRHPLGRAGAGGAAAPAGGAARPGDRGR